MSIIIIGGDPPKATYQEPVILEFEEESYEQLDVRVATQTPLTLSQVGDMVATIYKGNLVLHERDNSFGRVRN